MNFYKYQGTGNDFVMIDDRADNFPAGDQALIARLCDRRFGIGADGLILLRVDPDYDFRMIYFNADGAEGSMCGNGGRCIVQFAYDLGIFTDTTRFIAVDGEHTASVSDDVVSLKMSNVTGMDMQQDYTFLNTGSPHVVRFVDDLESYDVVGVGKQIRYSDTFKPGGTNVNFVQVMPDKTLFVRTYERGVEDETYSCGTGVTAAALTAYKQFGLPSPVSIRVLGGQLRVSFEETGEATFESIYLTGPAKQVFTGSATV
ncbi:diaminopimelate epimerase [Arsenicibacter rosenii]|uniref:Diaminopimelate epimerase n=1 Tax=Arsenicibacter rosenii TaxID=1750698 RepID=A0A1S2VI95_9BACT|nr:diaminopimelate epimerase [Arsenicibacter rosenii]OIN58130.1 diaminopimelate epimerase [Arsenicibacter rosenii]